jgi:predicted dehydrogenase
MAELEHNELRLAIIGAGGISRAHARGIIAHKEKVTCVALCDLSKANLKRRSDQLGGSAAQFNDWKTMFKTMGDEIDAVVICLPHHLHARAILDSAAAGKHILCEKPMCMNLRRCLKSDEMCRLDRGIQRGQTSKEESWFDPER